MISAIKGLISGAIDLHIHASFETPPRRQNMLEVAKDGVEAGMRAMAFKSKDTCTVDSARLVGSLVDGIGVYGGIVLDHSVGDLTPWLCIPHWLWVEKSSGCQASTLLGQLANQQRRALKMEPKSIRDLWIQRGR